MRAILLLVALAAGCDESAPTATDAGARPDAVATGLGPDGGGVPDAPPVCTPGTTQLLVNPGFDQGPGVGWLESGGAIILADAAFPDTPDQGGHAVRILGGNALDHVLAQPVAVPPFTARLTLEAKRCWVNAPNNPVPGDAIAIELTDAGGAVVEALLAAGNLDAPGICNWEPLVLPAAAPHAGEPLTLRLRGASDGAGIASFYFDTLALTAEVTCQ